MPLDIFDPHFHIWDTSDDSCMDSSILFKPNGQDIYNTSDYEKDMSQCGFNHTGGVFIEAMSVCYKEKSPEELNEYCKEEGRWVVKHLTQSDKKYNAVLSACLEADNIEETLKSLISLETPTVKVVGIRQIINFEPNWPRNKENLLKNKNWISGLKLLIKFNLSFDMQINIHQIPDAVSVIKEVGPALPVVINHIGCTTAVDLQNEENLFSQFKTLSSLPQVFMKLSMMCYTDKNFNSNESVHKLVSFLIKNFTSSRCMFASNYPVDIRDGWPASKLFTAYRSMVADLPEEDQQKLFGETARTFYKV